MVLIARDCCVPVAACRDEWYCLDRHGRRRPWWVTKTWSFIYQLCAEHTLRRNRMLHRILILPLFLSLGLDTLAVAVGLGISGLDRRDRIRVGMSFALAEGIMPLVGFLLGDTLARVVGSIAGWVAAA